MLKRTPYGFDGSETGLLVLSTFPSSMAVTVWNGSRGRSGSAAPWMASPPLV